MKKLNIIYEDKELLVIDKPSGQYTIGTEKDKFNSLYHEVREYIRKKNQKVFIVNRLDKDTSGIVVFAKNETLKSALQNNWNNITKRYYYAIVEGKVSKKEDTLKNYLEESKTLQVYVTNKINNAKQAITHYKVINELSRYTLLDIDIKTGRKNQIRCQLDYIGHPIVGDKKYSSKVNPIGRLGVHAYKLILTHPRTKKTYEFESKIPKLFLDYFPKK